MFFIDKFVGVPNMKPKFSGQRDESSMVIRHMTVGGGVRPPPPYKTFYHRKTDFLFVKPSFLVKFRQPVRSSYVKPAGST